MSGFYPLKVSAIVRETPDCLAIRFNVPHGVEDKFKFIQGQYLTLKFDIGGEEIRRSYSICSSPLEKELWVAVKLIPGGKMSSHIHANLKLGDTVQSMSPNGKFYTSLNPYNKNHYHLFAVGSGITPILSHLKTILETESQAQVLLYYGNRNEESIIFKSTLESLQRKHGERLQVHYIFSQPLGNYAADLTGRIDGEKVGAILENKVDKSHNNLFFICGPGDMMVAVQASLLNHAIDPSKINLEFFQAPVSNSPIEAEKINTAGSSHGGAKVTYINDGETYVVELKPEQSLLDAALEANIDAAFACKGGSCCTCRAKIIEGEVKMKVNYALSASEVEQGYVLTCQSHPITQTVTVDYDKGK